jgi:hypothetical protein
MPLVRLSNNFTAVQPAAALWIFSFGWLPELMIINNWPFFFLNAVVY